MKFLLTAFFLAGETTFEAGSPWAVLWTGPAILISSLMIAWGAEATQFFLAQGIALAMLALLQTLPEFAVEAVLAWHQQTPLLFASLTGALMYLTGLGWPMIYFSAATAHRREGKGPLRSIRLEDDHAIQIVSLFVAIGYEFIVWWKGSLTVADGIVLLAIYGAYLWIMRRLPPEEPETLDEITGIPKAIVLARKPVRIGAILGLFVIGGAAVFLIAEPFLAGLFGVSLLLGVSRFRFISWIAPLVSEAPEGISAYYWARDPGRASIALMNLVSSNINQWTLLAALLPMVLSVSTRHFTPIPLDATQSRDFLLTLSQASLGAMFLLNMELVWWEAVGLLVLFIVQFADVGGIRVYVTWIYLAWAGVELLLVITGNRKAAALRHFRRILRHK